MNIQKQIFQLWTKQKLFNEPKLFKVGLYLFGLGSNKKANTFLVKPLDYLIIPALLNKS